MTNEDIIKLVREVADKDKVDPVHNDMVTLTIEELGKLLAAEREAIAKMFDDPPPLVDMARSPQGGCVLCGFTPEFVAFAIRERGAP